MLISLKEIDSTNNYLKARAHSLDTDTVAVAEFQTAGRGQRGNGWESAPGENLLMSMLHFPQKPLHPSRQFMISKAAALAVRRLVAELLTEASADSKASDSCVSAETDEAASSCVSADTEGAASSCVSMDSEASSDAGVYVKWPNDIYIGDRKVAGILIENSIATAASGTPVISQSVIGIGLNLNQLEFTSPAPNPVSVSQITGLRYAPLEIAERLTAHLSEYLRLLFTASPQLDSEYLSHLWRSRGFHRYLLLKPSLAPSPTAIIAPQSPASASAPPSPEARNTSAPASASDPSSSNDSATHSRLPRPEGIIEAEIISVAPDGPIMMRTRDGTLHSFAFKEITPIL